MKSFDNDISILLKKARELKIPSKFVRFSNNIYTNLIDEINNLILAGKTLNELYDLFETIEPEDLIMIYSLKEKDSLKKINLFYESLRLPKIRDNSELILLNNSWRQKINDDFEYDMNKLDNIESIQKELLKYTPLEYSPINVDSTIIFAEMKFKNDNIPTIDDGYEIFDLSIPNKTLPYIRWNTGTKNKEVIKLYKGKTVEERPDYSKIIPSSSKEIPNSFNFSVLKGEGVSYLKGTYSLETNLMKIKIPTESNKEKVLENISKSFPLDIKSIDEKSISGDLLIYDIDINDLLLSDMILNDEAFNNYLFMKEISSPFALKKQIKLNFRSLSGLALESDEKPSSVAFSITQNYAKEGEIVKVLKNGKVEEKILKYKDPYIKINISSGDSLKIANDFVNIFSILLTRYKLKKDNLEKLYISWIPEFANYNELVLCPKKVEITNDTKINQLKQTAPDLFISGYARKCLCKKQPIPILEEEIESWKEKTFTYK